MNKLKQLQNLCGRLRLDKGEAVVPELKITKSEPNIDRIVLAAGPLARLVPATPTGEQFTEIP
jgi:hypothetical protein